MNGRQLAHRSPMRRWAPAPYFAARRRCPCIAVAPNRPQVAEADAGLAKPDVILFVDKIEADAGSNGAAFEQQYIGKVNWRPQARRLHARAG
jgi:hypothetical protein